MIYFNSLKHNELLTKKNIIEKTIPRGLNIPLNQDEVNQGNKIKRSVVSKGSLQMIKAKYEVKHLSNKNT
ncbi:MAG: hypothetical protein COB67_08910 [SAR324 cluster bacterium]|uniref:Uncharacterized protein n=1 Tax=SAR324 cluster bacterium TaxID=2024889 RepID=A0A2A4T1I5_9DELT|nr:MAG: hypothetical protein COB67_08910 [SAR324 cluster bacterium]